MPPRKKPKVTAFIDADIILYRAASFCEEDFGDDKFYDAAQGERFFDSMLDRWIEELSTKYTVADYYLTFTNRGNFRKDLYPDYKANRKDLHIWPGLRQMKNNIMDRIGVVYENNIEADDIIGIRCTEDRENTIAVSADKDFQTVPCRLMIPCSHGRTAPLWYDTTEAEADLYWIRQAITGDVIDNYKGIRGYGAVKAVKAVPDALKGEPPERLWEAALSAFTKAGYDEAYALLMVRLARILRTGEYNFDTKEIKLWEPKSPV